MSLRDRIEDFKDNFEENDKVAVVALLSFALIFGRAFIVDNQQVKNADFEVKEAPILAKLSEQNITENRNAISDDGDYRFILDVDEDGVYNKNKDVVISGYNVPYYLLKKDNRIVYLEESYKNNVRNKIPLVLKDKEENSYLLGNVEDVYSDKVFRKNESLNKANQLFKDKYINQR